MQVLEYHTHKTPISFHGTIITKNCKETDRLLENPFFQIQKERNDNQLTSIYKILVTKS